MVALIKPHPSKTYAIEDTPASAPVHSGPTGVPPAPGAAPWWSDRSEARRARFFSLEQRARLRGVHSRVHAPRVELAYAAGVALRSSSGPGGRLRAYVVIGEVDTDQRQPVLRVAEHLGWTGAVGSGLAPLLQWLGAHWRCCRILVAGAGASDLAMASVEALPPTGAARASLAIGLLRAVNAGRIQLPAPDRSQECQELWAQIVKAQCRAGPDGSFDFFVSPETGGDGWLVALGLAAEAGRPGAAPGTPSQGFLTGLLCA